MQRRRGRDCVDTSRAMDDHGPVAVDKACSSGRAACAELGAEWVMAQGLRSACAAREVTVSTGPS